MDTSTGNEKATSEGKITRNAIHVRITDTTRILLQELMGKANKKEFGRKIKQNEIVFAGLRLVELIHLKELQENSLSNADRMELVYRDHVKQFGDISKDKFIGKLMCGEIKTEKYTASGMV